MPRFQPARLSLYSNLTLILKSRPHIDKDGFFVTYIRLQLGLFVHQKRFYGIIY